MTPITWGALRIHCEVGICDAGENPIFKRKFPQPTTVADMHVLHCETFVGWSWADVGQSYTVDSGVLG